MQVTSITNWIVGRESFNASHRKEDHFFKEVAFFTCRPVGPGNKNGTNPTLYPALTIHFYQPGTVCYCCFWLHCGDAHINGSGKAGGYGYHKPSAAFQSAINSAGVKLSESIGAVGDDAIEETGKAILSFFGANTLLVHTAQA